MKGMIGKKLGMTQVFEANGSRVSVTAVEAGPCPILALRTRERDGYSAIQLGFGARKAKNTSKAMLGHCRKGCLADKAPAAEDKPAAAQDPAAAAKKNEEPFNPPAVCREIRLAEDSQLAVGTRLRADVFSPGEFVDVTATSKGRGFQGVVRRHHFAGGRATHGGAWTRRTGSIGMKARPGRVIKGRRMPGRMGGERCTVQNLRIVAVRPEENLLLIAGAVPGPNGGFVTVRSAIKK